MEDKKFIKDEMLPTVQDGMLQKIKNFLVQQYQAASLQDADVFFMNTKEIYDGLLQIYPNEHVYTAADVAEWLQDAGFQFFDAGKMQLEWILRKR